MLFKSMEHRFCQNCAHAAEADEDQMLCRKKGLVARDHRCSFFRYDPLKRDPARPKKAASAQPESDFSL